MQERNNKKIFTKYRDSDLLGTMITEIQPEPQSININGRSVV